MSGTGRVRAQRADTWLKLWHPDSPGVRVFIAPSRWRRWGIVRSKFATLGEVKRMYEAMEDPVTDSPRNWASSPDEPYFAERPGPDQCPECGAVEDIEYAELMAEGYREMAEPEPDRFACRPIPLREQALWLARHIESVTSPRPDVVSDDEIRGMTLIRVLGIGADEYGDAVFRKSSAALRQDAAEEWSDAEWYDLVERFGDELR